MKKVLFTDLFGTLISPDSSISKQYFGDMDRELRFVSQYLNEFLNKDNYVAVVTNVGGHGDRIAPIINNELTKLNSYILKDLRTHIIYYLIFNREIEEDACISKENVDGKMCYIGNHSFKTISIDKKEEAINDFLETMKEPYQIYGIGDSEKDIPMLLRVEGMGGKSSFIDTYLYRHEKTIDKIIEDELHVEYHFEMQKNIRNMTMEERERGDSEELYSLLVKREKRKQELYELLYSGELNLDELNRNYNKFMEISYYEMNNGYEYDKFWENYPFCENLVRNVMNMSCYSSFSEYYTKVLKRC